MTSWATCLYLAWLCQWRPGTTAVIQTLKETKAAELIRYIAILTENQEPFLQERHPVARSVALEIEWKMPPACSASRAEKIKSACSIPFVAVFDEMAFMEDASACYAAVAPVAKQIIGVSSSIPGWMGDQCSDLGEPIQTGPYQRKPEYPIDRRECWER